jgi:serine/threonine protein kinase
VVHEFIGPNGSPLPDEKVPITMKTITLTKLIYRSPDGGTEVHEGTIKYTAGKFAIKIMNCVSEADLAKKQKESELQQNMKHPNICECVASFKDESQTAGCRFIIVMEFSEDGDIEQEADKRKLKKNPWTETELFGHFRELIDAFGFMQDRNLTHGDVKPRNLYLLGGKIKIGDFGESKQSMQALVTQTYQVTGTVIYFSPILFEAYLNIIKGKNLKGQVRHNPIKSDVFSLGLSFLHMASLNKPAELNNLELGADSLQSAIDRTVNKLQYSDSLKQLLLKMLQVQETKRYDFKQLRNFLNPTNERPQSIEEPPKLGKQSTIRATYPVLVSITQIQGNAVILDSNDRELQLKSHRIQSSASVLILTDSLIVSGGLKNSKSVFKINISTGASVKLQDMNEERSWHTMILHLEKLFVIGGRDTRKESLASCESLGTSNDIENQSWNREESLQNCRENATALSVNQDIFVFGGVAKVGIKRALLDTVERYSNGSWSTLEIRLVEPASGIGLVFFSTDEIWLVGGSLDKGNMSKRFFKLLLGDDNSVRGLEECKETLDNEDYFSSAVAYKKKNNEVVLLGNHRIDGYHKYDKSQNKWSIEKFTNTRN